MLRLRTDYIVIHCSATRPAMDVGAKDIKEWHMKGNGWDDIGYHYVIRRNGKIEEGRPVNHVGAHVKGYNHCSIGVCLVGGVSQENFTKAEDNFTKEQKETLVDLLRTLKKEYPKAQILGHRDLQPGKECPSFRVALFLKEWKV